MPKNINKVVQATEAVEGDVTTNLALLLPHVETKSERAEWLSQIKDWKTRFPFNYEKEVPNGLIKPQSVIEKLSKMTENMKERVIITTGVGQHRTIPEISLELYAQTNVGRNVGCSALSMALPPNFHYEWRSWYHVRTLVCCTERLLDANTIIDLGGSAYLQRLGQRLPGLTL